MKVKKVLRKVLLVLYWIAVCYITLQFIMGETNVLCIIAVCLTCLYFLMKFIAWLGRIYIIYNKHTVYKVEYEYLKALHKERYKFYFSEEKEKIEVYSKEIERYGKALIKIGEERLKEKKMNKKMCKEVQEIIDKIKILMQTIQPPTE